MRFLKLFSNDKLVLEITKCSFFGTRLFSVDIWTFHAANLYISVLCVVNRRYYKKQDELISTYEGIHLDNSALDNESKKTHLRRQASRLAKLSFFANFVSRNQCCNFLRGDIVCIAFCRIYAARLVVDSRLNTYFIAAAC